MVKTRVGVVSGNCGRENQMVTIVGLTLTALVRISLLEHAAHVAQEASPASSRTVSVRRPLTGGETPPELAGGDACATCSKSEMRTLPLVRVDNPFK